MEQTPFSELSPSAATHFRLHFYGAVMRVISLVVDSLGGTDQLVERFPFLRDYMNELAQHGLEGISFEHAPAWWSDATARWEKSASCHLPLRALREALGFDHDAAIMLVAVGLAEEDAQFADVFQMLHGNTSSTRPSVAILGALSASRDRADIRSQVRRLVEHGLVQVKNADELFPAWNLVVPNLLWDVIRGDVPEFPAPGLRYLAPGQWPPIDQLILPPTLRPTVERLPTLLRAGDLNGIIVRGPHRNGRRTVLGAVAAAAGYGVLEVRDPDRDDERWRRIGPLATLLHAIPVVMLDAAPGETVSLPTLGGYRGARGFVLGTQGGISAANSDRMITLTLGTPDVALRRQHWAGSVGEDAAELDRIAPRFRMSGGNIRRAAALARSCATLAGRDAVTLDDARAAASSLNREALDNLATHEPAHGERSRLVCSAVTQQEFETLEARCRQREQLAARVGPALSGSVNAGVRALFKGPSGTGKTLAARVLGGILGMDLYRVDLSAVVNKYIGETEKNLNRIFARAEELDVILLFDEGDALLGRRTSVQTANDRYANLETNFLLQRLEAHEGIVLITTNAADHIDSAFQRRMDIVVDFRPPEAAERLAIWRLHLPADHDVAESVLRDVAQRCQLTGGQIRNAVLHAALLAGTDGCSIGGAQLDAAIQREYRKLGSACPLRRASRPTAVNEAC